MSQRGRKPTGQPRRDRTTMTLAPHLIRAADEMVKRGQFRSRSHAVEAGLQLLIAVHRADLPAETESASAIAA